MEEISKLWGTHKSIVSIFLRTKGPTKNLLMCWLCYVASCKNNIIMYILTRSKLFYLILLKYIYLCCFIFLYSFQKKIVVSSCSLIQFSCYVLLLLFVFLIVFCCMATSNLSLEVLVD